MIRHFAWVSAPLLLLLGSHASADLERLATAYKFQEHKFPVVDDSGRCGRTPNPAAKLGKVRFAQTHLMEPSWPFFYLAGERPALITVNLEGTGNAPDVRMTASVEGVVVGSACLAGPSSIPPTISDTTPSLSTLYAMTLPKEWMKPGLSVVIEAGSERKEFTAQQLKVKDATEVNLLIMEMEVLDYNKGRSESGDPKDFLADLAGELPASVTRVGHLPVRMVYDKLVFSDATYKPVLVCGSEVVDRKDCENLSLIPATQQKDAVLRSSKAVFMATGLYYAAGYSYAKSLGMGLGGIAMQSGRYSQGWELSGTFLHELGHSMSLSHWHEVYPDSSPKSWEYSYPYGGPKGNGGGRGPNWNWETNTREFVSPLCQEPIPSFVGLERKDQMSYLGIDCMETRKKGWGPWVGYSDFSAYSIHEFLSGNDTTHGGSVPYRDSLRKYQVPDMLGQPTLKFDPSGKARLVRTERQPVPNPMRPYEELEERAFLLPSKAEVPVYLVYGSHHPLHSKANILYKPLAFMGNYVELIDPTDPKTFADLKEDWFGVYGTLFVFEHDITLRFTYSDGSKKTAIYPHESSNRWLIGQDPWEHTLLNFALLVPADKPLSKVEVLWRPFLSRSSSDTSTGNINAPGSTITAANFMDDAKLLFERSFDDVMPPTGIDMVHRSKSDLEKLGGHVTVRGLDGRVVGEFDLEVGSTLERRARDVVKRRGVWLVQLKNGSGALSRTIAIQ